MKKMISLFTILLGISVIFSLTVFAAAPGRPLIEGATPASTTNKTLRTSDHDLIRSGVAWYGKCYPSQTASVESLEYWQRAKDVGLNAIRITNWDQRSFAGHYDDESGYNECTYEGKDSKGRDIYHGAWTIAKNLLEVDKMVQHAADTGMYIIITPGDTPGTMSRPYLEAFWGIAADRYKNNTHVIYEITNEPAAWKPSAYDNTVLNNLAAVYRIMRSAAPNTPILSLAFPNSSENMNGKVSTFTTKVNATAPTLLVWSNNVDVVSFHTYSTTDMTDINNLRAVYPVMNTEWGYPGSGGVLTLAGNKYHGQKLEETGISWMNFQAGRTNGQFTKEYFNFANDAKLKDYFWIKPDTYSTGLLGYKDDLVDLTTKVHSFSPNMQIAAGNPPYFNGDANRATRTDTSTGHIIYKAPGLGKFKAHIYSHNNYNGIKFYISRNGTVWEQLAVTRSASVATSGGWEGATYSSTNALPGGTEYLKVELSSTSTSYDTQIADMVIANWSTVWEVEDNLTAWSVADSYSSNMTFATAGPANFNGDSSRATRNDTNPGHIIYKLTDLGGFYANIYSQTNPIPDPNPSVKFYSSTNGTSWTVIPVTGSAQVATSGGWRQIYYQNSGSLPTGTQYVKVEFTSTASANESVLSNMIMWVKY
jgi:hypothetical protein